MPLTVEKLFELLSDEYGETHWWPGETPFEVMVGAILTQNTSWMNVERAISNLKRKGMMSPRSISKATEDELREAIIPSGFYRQKARYVAALARFLQANYSGRIDRMKSKETRVLREELLQLPGIGPETADSILLYSLGRPSFVVDAYTRRLLERLRIGHGKSYESVKAMFEAELQGDVHMYAEMHALIVLHCKEVCRREPLCAECILRTRCPSNREEE